MRATFNPTPKSTHASDAAAALVAQLPRDQALGLRLLCLARAATSIHMGQACAPSGESCASGRTPDLVSVHLNEPLTALSAQGANA